MCVIEKGLTNLNASERLIRDMTCVISATNLNARITVQCGGCLGVPENAHAAECHDVLSEK